jgi:hypothetical protein
MRYEVFNNLKNTNTLHNIHTSIIVSNASLFVLMTERVFSQHLLKTPSTPVIPIPSIMSLVSRNGTCKQRYKLNSSYWRRKDLHDLHAMLSPQKTKHKKHLTK